MEKGSTQLILPRYVVMKHTVSVCGEYFLSCLLSLMRSNPRAALICMKPKFRCTFIGRIVFILTGIEMKTWLLSHFHDRTDQRPLWLPAFTTLHPLRASRPNLTHY